MQIIIPGNPVAKGRSRAEHIRRKGGALVTDKNGNPIIRHRTPETTALWESTAKLFAAQGMAGAVPYTCPVRLYIIAVFGYPAWPAWKNKAFDMDAIGHACKPDLDNVVKAVKDAFNGVVWLDDSLVLAITAQKVYGETPRVIANVEKAGLIPSNHKNKPTVQELRAWGMSEEKIADLVTALGLK